MEQEKDKNAGLKPGDSVTTRFSTTGEMEGVVIALIFFALAAWLSTIKYIPVTENDLVKVPGKLEKTPVIFKDNHGRKSITLFLDTFRNYNFIMSGFPFEVAEPLQLVDKLKVGDSLNTWILNRDLDEAIAHPRPEKGTDHYLPVYKLSYKDIEYIDLVKLNNAESKDNKFTWLVGPIILILLGLFFARKAIRRRIFGMK